MSLATSSIAAGPPVLGRVRGATAPDSYKFLSISSHGNLQINVSSAGAGGTAYYVLRWVSTRGEKGPWSEVAEAILGA